MPEKIRCSKFINKRLLYVFISFTFILISSCGTFQKVRTSDALFVNNPKLITQTLPNGFKYILMKNKKPADRVSMHLVVKSGSMNETEEQRGLAHYLEHMLFNGSKHFPPGELIKFFQSIGMNFGGDANAHTGFYETVYDIVLPKGNEKELSEGLLVMQDYAESALLLESEIQKEKNIILAEKRDRDSASYRMFESTLKFEIEGMKIPERLPIGTKKTILSANKKYLKEYYDTWYRPSKMVLVVVGDFNTNAAKRMIEGNFSAIKARAPKKREYKPGEISHKGIKTFHHFEKELGKTTISIETIDDTPWIKDSLAKRKKELISKLANDILQNRLDVLISKPDAPFTTASASSGTYLRNVKYSDISAECNPEKWENALSEIEKTLRAALKYGFYDQELKRAKDNYIALLKRGVKEAETQNSNLLARQIASSVTSEKIFLSPEDKLKLFEPFLESLQTEDVNNSLRNSWSADHRLVIVNGNVDLKKKYTDAGGKIHSVYMNSYNAQITRPTQEKEVAFPYLPKPEKKGKIIKKVQNETLGTTSIEFDNGVVLNLKKTDFKANQVLYKVIFGSGKKNEPADKPGLASLSTSLINESGFGQLDNDELKRALTGKNTSLSFNTGTDNFNISGRSVSGESELMMQLIRTQILDPGFRKDAYKLIMKKMKQSYLQMESTIEGADLLYAKKFLANNDSRFGLPAYEVYASNSIEDVKNWAGEAIKTEGLELSIVGDFSVEHMIELCSLYLGSLPQGRKPVAVNKSRRIPPDFPFGKELNVSVKTKVPKSLVKVAYKTDDFWNIKRTRRLAALGTVFSDRLRNTIREELGAAYSPYAYNNSSTAYANYGIFQAVISIKPGQEKIVTEKVKEIAKQLSDVKIGQDELKRAIDPILTQIKDLRETNSYWLNSVLSGSDRFPEKLEWAKTIETDYSAITADDILFYAKKYLNNQVSATISITTEQ